MFYTFNQNNSGGQWEFDTDSGVGFFVIVEASSKDDAIRIAETIGLYFDGMGDCPCCGNRWSTWCEESETPSLYKADVIEDPNGDGFVHFADGSKRRVARADFRGSIYEEWLRRTLGDRE